MRDRSHSEQIRRLREGGKVRPADASVPALSVNPCVSDCYIMLVWKALRIGKDVLFDDRSRFVHFAEAHVTPSNSCPDGATD